jgi:transcriptional repressor NrdR
MRCPFCGHDDTQVKDSRPSEDGSVIRRRRACPKCDSRFTTFERIQLRELVVIKKNGEKKPFDLEKVVRSMQIACRKRPVSQEQIEATASRIMRTLEMDGEIEVSAEHIGEVIMDELSKLDKVAYIRFASVYKDFREAKDFEEFMEKIEK